MNNKTCLLPQTQLNDCFLVNFLYIQITIPSSCDDSSTFVGYKIEVDKLSIDSLCVTISFIEIPCLNYVTRYLYILKEIISKTNLSDCG